jgi:uncharacterized protein (DUF4415 family)
MPEAGTNRGRVRREAAQDAPIDADLAQEPYDPSDPAAVVAYWAQATIKQGRVLALLTPAEDAAIAAGIGQDPDTYEPSANEIATMKRPGRPLGSGSKTNVTLRLDTAAIEAFRVKA